MTENQEWVFNAIRFERTVHLCIKDFEGWKYRYVPLPLNEDDILDFAGRWESSNDIYKKQVEGKMAQFVREYETDTIENKGIVERQLNYTIKWLPENEKWLKLITYSLKIQDESLAKNELEGDTLRAVTKQRKDLYRAFNVMKTCIEMAKWLKYEIVDKLPATPQVVEVKRAEVVCKEPTKPQKKALDLMATHLKSGLKITNTIELIRKNKDSYSERHLLNLYKKVKDGSLKHLVLTEILLSNDLDITT